MMLRRSFLALVALTGVLLAGCAGTDGDPAPTGDSVTLTHAFGETVVTGQPSRVVALGWNDLAVANALGAPIVGAVKYFDPANPNLPYIRTPLGADLLTLNAAEVNIEQIAALEPDLILATSSNQLNPDSYAQLAGLAPTLAYQKSLYGSTMEEDALFIGRALRNEEGAQRLVDEAHAAVEKVKTELPGLAGGTYLFGQARGEVLPLVVGKENLSTLFMASLGLSVPAPFADAPADDTLAPGTIGISYERVSELDSADALFMTFPSAADQQTFENNALVKRLAVVREGRYLATPLPAAQLLQGPNVVGVPWLLEQLRPTLAKIGA